MTILCCMSHSKQREGLGFPALIDTGPVLLYCSRSFGSVLVFNVTEIPKGRVNARGILRLLFLDSWVKVDSKARADLESSSPPASASQVLELGLCCGTQVRIMTLMGNFSVVFVFDQGFLNRLGLNSLYSGWP